MKKEQTFEMKKIIKKNNGITLIALVITIIVLLILAGVTIATLTGENGILTRASDASEQTELADEREKVELATIGALAKENGGEISQTSLEEELGKYFENGKYAVEPGTNEDGTEGYIVTITENDEQGRIYFVDKNGNVEDYIVREPAEPTEGTGTNFNMSYGVIEVEFLGGTSYNATTTPNHPVLKEGMTAITYNESTGETTNVSNSSGTDWYSYVAGSGANDNNASHWANAKVTVDSVDSYFVWIPRYAYRIIYFDSQDSENAYRSGTLTEEAALANNQILGYSDARGIVDTEGKTKEGVSVQTAISVNDKYFKTHPAFEDNVDYGGWSSILEGIWIAKYEASKVGNKTTPKFEPGISSWRSITIGNMFTYAQRYNPTLNSHMMKNSEWGAVAYLTESKYGRNGTEVTINNNSNYLTGNAGDNVSASSSTTTNAYNTEKGVLASSTGNIYGIYDLSGNAYEYVSGYYTGSSDLTNGSLFANGISDAYSTAYSGTTASSAYKYGDATYETNGWNSDDAYFVDWYYPFFYRGGCYDDTSNAGVFDFYSGYGNEKREFSFRVSLAVQ